MIDGKRKAKRKMPIVIVAQNNVMTTLTLQQHNGMLQAVAVGATPITPPAAPRFYGGGYQFRVRFAWHYTRKGVERPGRKSVRMHMVGLHLKYLVDDIVKFIRHESWDCETNNARLVIYSQDTVTDAEKVLYDIPCPVRVMNKVKKRFSYVNG